jgi:hypothetical protein
MSDLRTKYESSFATDTVIVPANATTIKEAFYSNLTVLDSKASALMTFDGILVAVASLTLQDGGVLEGQWPPLLVIIMTLLAAGLCLFVAQISYPFLGKVTTVKGTPSKLDFSKELESLHRAVDWRTGLYRFAWLLSVLATALFLIIFIVALLTYSAEGAKS